MSWLIPSIPGWSRSSLAAAGPSTVPTPNGNSTKALDDVEEDIDAPPPFPLLNSHQRSNASSTPSFSVAPPSPPKSPSLSSTPPSDLNIAIVPDNVPLGNMAPPPSTTKKPNFGIQKGGQDSSSSTSSTNGLTPASGSTEKKEKKKRAKVALTPGHSALDWARLTSSGEDLRQTGGGFLRVTMAELKEHNTVDDAWSAFNGMVYNITAYLPFHPGGEDELMRVAGRDGTKLFMLTHSWVNLDFMLKECMVGVLVRG
ncbi:hypothetical protein CI109_103175 [Kwoniella shandongensis]|uniref:Uncharacterized protein n=1 Tax=Kwoniella shandongensis TaxID=1734106 RepID=A0A5M6C8V1_9TREE|nr:uncharacterized protein CI109_000366 [Kwoniella shandongensis]KAA5531524.1 hypothetical protein CI109_000366 [Kwoniella shandongensis]